MRGSYTTLVFFSLIGGGAVAYQSEHILLSDQTRFTWNTDFGAWSNVLFVDNAELQLKILYFNWWAETCCWDKEAKRNPEQILN